MPMENKRSVSFWCPDKIVKFFQEKYPYCMSRFLLNCVKKAIDNKQFFDSIYFDL